MSDHGNTGRRAALDTRAERARKLRADYPLLSNAEIARRTGMTRQGAGVALRSVSPAAQGQARKGVKRADVARARAALSAWQALVGELSAPVRACAAAEAMRSAAVVHASALCELRPAPPDTEPGVKHNRPSARSRPQPIGVITTGGPGDD